MSRGGGNKQANTTMKKPTAEQANGHRKDYKYSRHKYVPIVKLQLLCCVVVKACETFRLSVSEKRWTPCPFHRKRRPVIYIYLSKQKRLAQQPCPRKKTRPPARDWHGFPLPRKNDNWMGTPTSQPKQQGHVLPSAVLYIPTKVVPP